MDKSSGSRDDRHCKDECNDHRSKSQAIIHSDMYSN